MGAGASPDLSLEIIDQSLNVSNYIGYTSLQWGSLKGEAVTRGHPGTAAELPNLVIMVSQNILRSLCFAPAEDVVVVIIVFLLIANDKTLCLSFFVGGPLDMIVMNN